MSVHVNDITGQVATTLIGTDFGLLLTRTKQSFQVESVEALPEILAEAFNIAISSCPGPALIDIPKDIQIAEWAGRLYSQPCLPIPPLQAEAMTDTPRLLPKGEKPVFF